MIQTVAYRNKNLLSYSEYGDKIGHPILVQHGLIASIRDYHLFDRLIEAGTHLICMARPGYGESSPYRMSHLAEWGELVAVLVNELQLPQFDILGMSSGAPYSYAIGYKLPEQVRNIFIFSGTPALYDERVLALWPYPVNQQASLLELERVAKELFFSDVAPDDLLRNDIRDSMRNDCFGIAQDLKLRCLGWGFDLSEVQATVYMQHSRADERVPFNTAGMTAHMLPRCQLDIRASGGHFSEELLDAFIETTMVKHYESRHDCLVT
jgi:pimeloyl-ACP methyl ester carboxylesterase